MSTTSYLIIGYPLTNPKANDSDELEALYESRLINKGHITPDKKPYIAHFTQYDIEEDALKHQTFLVFNMIKMEGAPWRVTLNVAKRAFPSKYKDAVSDWMTVGDFGYYVAELPINRSIRYYTAPNAPFVPLSESQVSLKVPQVATVTL